MDARVRAGRGRWRRGWWTAGLFILAAAGAGAGCSTTPSTSEAAPGADKPAAAAADETTAPAPTATWGRELIRMPGYLR